MSVLCVCVSVCAVCVFLCCVGLCVWACTHPCVVSLGVQQGDGERGGEAGRVHHVSESEPTFSQEPEQEVRYTQVVVFCVIQLMNEPKDKPTNQQEGNWES